MGRHSRGDQRREALRDEQGQGWTQGRGEQEKRVNRNRGSAGTGVSRNRGEQAQRGAEATCGALMRVQAGQVQLLNKVAWSTAAAAASGGTHPPPPCSGRPSQIYPSVLRLLQSTSKWILCF